MLLWLVEGPVSSKKSSASESSSLVRSGCDALTSHCSSLGRSKWRSRSVRHHGNDRDSLIGINRQWCRCGNASAADRMPTPTPSRPSWCLSTAEKSGPRFVGPFPGYTFPSLAAPRAAARLYGRRAAVSIESPPARSTLSAVSHSSVTMSRHLAVATPSRPEISARSESRGSDLRGRGRSAEGSVGLDGERAETRSRGFAERRACCRGLQDDDGQRSPGVLLVVVDGRERA